MLKYQLKKDVTLEDGIAFKYKSNEELEALISALNEKFIISTEKINSGISKGFLIVMDTKKIHCLPLLNSKFFTRSDQYLVKKKDVFNKTEYDNGPKNNKKHIGKYDNESNLREQNDVNNNECPNNNEGPNKPFVAYAITDGCGLRVPFASKEGQEELKLNQEYLKKVLSRQENLERLIPHSIFDLIFKEIEKEKEYPIGTFEDAVSLDGKQVVIYTRKDGSKVIID